MEKFNLTQTGQEVQNILNGATSQLDLTAEVERAQEAERALGEGVQQNADDIDAIEEKIPSGTTDENPLTNKEYVDGLMSDEATARENADTTLQGAIDGEETRAKAAEKQNADDIDAIEEKIPSAASQENQLADKAFVNSSIATNTATFRGTFNLVSNLHLTLDATEQQIATALASAIVTADNNDYCFIQVPVDVETPTVIGRIDRYKFNGEAWAFEYTLNNSGFTAAQWDAINSGITTGDVTKLAALPTNAQLTILLNGLQSAIGDEELRAREAEQTLQGNIDAEETRAKEAEQTNANAIANLKAVVPADANYDNKLTTKRYVDDAVATNSATFRGTFNLITELHLTLQATHLNIGTALDSAISGEDNNDFAFVQIPVSMEAPLVIGRIERYKYNGESWLYEYELNNSGFTQEQWDAINSGITSGDVTKLRALPTNAQLTTLLTGLQSAISQEVERAQVAEQGLNSRLETVEELAEISIDGGTIGLASPQDFDDPTPEQKAKVATVGSIIDGPGINIHLTEQEYDALTDEQKMNGSWYFIEE